MRELRSPGFARQATARLVAEPLITGFDLGGAHLKAAQVTRAGELVAALQLPCPLWLGMDRLESALDQALSRLTPIGPCAVTMTGELADLFPDRATGVRKLIEALIAGLPAARHWIYAGRAGFLGPEQASARPLEVASANWQASAAWIAGQVAEALFLDIGSTTTDIVPLKGGGVMALGTTDRERLLSEELVYTGLTRTPLMAIASHVPFQGRRQALMAELFATAADVYRVLGELDEEMDQLPAADGGEKTADASARRLARMIGADLSDGTPEAWRELARAFAEAQLRLIHDSILTNLSRGGLSQDAPLIGAGIGRALLERLAGRLGRPCLDASRYFPSTPAAAPWAAHCAPAAAVALLLNASRIA
jgi:(4-(4-[2-(gamma-L-glutamylamino)ethyl]phenoxymethyl)furan-2-yl)methanamine synthase